MCMKAYLASAGYFTDDRTGTQREYGNVHILIDWSDRISFTVGSRPMKLSCKPEVARSITEDMCGSLVDIERDFNDKVISVESLS